MKRVAPAVLAAVLFVGSAGLTPPPPPTHAEWVASFARPTPEGRLASLRAMLDAHGLKYEIQRFSSGKPGVPEGYNVIVTLGAGEKDILLTAHYDAERLQDGTLVDGVVDNAASVVALVKAADALRGGLKNHRLRVVFFDQEELGLLGAKAYAAGEDGKRVAAVFNFDINAYGDTPFYALSFHPESVFLNELVPAGCKAAGETCTSFEVYPPSDHLAFRMRSIPATSFSYLPKAEVDELDAFMLESRKASRNQLPPPRILTLIHTPNDRMPAVDPATIERATRLAVAVAQAADAR